MLREDRRHVATDEVDQLTLDLDGLLHLWVGLEHTLVLSAGAVGDLVQAATQMEDLRTISKNSGYAFLRRPTAQPNDSFPLSRVENSCLRAWGGGGRKLRVHT